MFSFKRWSMAASLQRREDIPKRSQIFTVNIKFDENGWMEF